MAKVILISQFSLPYSNIGSWTTLYNTYLSGQHQIDIILCPRPATLFEDISYEYIRKSLFYKVRKILFGKTYSEYTTALKKVIQPGEDYIIQIIDNPGLTPRIGAFLRKHNLDKRCYVQFFHHGFSPFYNNYYSKHFFEYVNEMVLLTHASYKNFKEYYAVLPCRFSVLHNGISTKKFHPVTAEEKIRLKEELNLANKTVFIWCSQDRPKKGLDLLLDAWKRFYKIYPESELLVVGTSRKLDTRGVTCIGRIPNEKLPVYFQMSDVCIFPTLWHEGFGMSLIEALHSGCYCIASALGGVPEVLNYGQYGKLIENPNYINEWVDAMSDYMINNFQYDSISPQLYSSESWMMGMNTIIADAKLNLEN